MKSVITYNTRIFPKSKEDSKLLYNTMVQHQKVWNHISNYTFKTKNINKKLIHDANYHECRKLFPECPSQVIVRAKDSVYSTYKTIKSNKQLSKMGEPAKQHSLSMRLDKRIYTLERGNEYQTPRFV